MRRIAAATVALSLLAACSGSSDGGSSNTSAGAADTTTSAAPLETSTTGAEVSTASTEVGTTEPSPTAATETTASETTASATPVIDDSHLALASMTPPTGESIRLGLSNTEGAPGLDFPDIRAAIEGGVAYLNEHGGMGGRPIELVTCKVNGSPEGSQACAQELTGKDVDLVMLGLDLFADYATYTAADVPVVGALPILPTDFAADALFLTGGNVTIMAAMAVVAKDHFKADKVGIVSADNAGANSSATALISALDALGIAHSIVKGGDNETDAGFQGLLREAADGDPDVLVSLYSDAGCIGSMRARASLGIEIPVLTTGACSATQVLEQVGDDAVGWNFAGVATRNESPGQAMLQEIMAPVVGKAPDEVDSASLGLGALGLFLVMSLAVYGNDVAAKGTPVTGQAVYDYLGATDGLRLWPGLSPVDCGAEPKYPTICSFTFPFAEYVEGGEVRTIDGLDAVSVLGRLP